MTVDGKFMIVGNGFVDEWHFKVVFLGFFKDGTRVRNCSSPALTSSSHRACACKLGRTGRRRRPVLLLTRLPSATEATTSSSLALTSRPHLRTRACTPGGARARTTQVDIFEKGSCKEIYAWDLKDGLLFVTEVGATAKMMGLEAVLLMPVGNFVDLACWDGNRVKSAPRGTIKVVMLVDVLGLGAVTASAKQTEAPGRAELGSPALTSGIVLMTCA